jgi:protein tyrosine/serine phosphatase
VVENAANLPVLVHCHSANRVGAMWALYRASKGVPPAVAVEEGRTAGLKSREKAVREKLGVK